jgi:protein-disulfide isomerase
MLSLPRRVSRDLKVLFSSPLAIALAALFLGGAASTLAFFPREGVPGAAPVAASSQDQRSDFERWYTSQPRVSLVIPAQGAKVLVVKFNDYQCPPCRQSYMEYKSVFAKYESSQSGAVRLALKDFPLDSKCNANVTTTLHPAACDAAVAVRLAREHDRVVPLEDWLFANQPTLTPEAVRKAAREVGQVANFDARYEMTLEQVKADIAYGRQLGVRSTPTFFINGVKVEGALPAQYFDQAIAFELARAAK